MITFLKRPLSRVLGLGIVVLAVSVPISAFSKDKGKGKADNVANDLGDMSSLLSPYKNMYLRSSFDKDPSMYVGRFVPRDVKVPDESAAMTTACSKYVSYKFVEGGGTVRDEFYRTNSSAAASLGIAQILQISGKNENSRVVRVKYTETGKLVPIIDDPAGFKSCCLEADDQCTDSYIGEFIMGRGALYVAKGIASTEKATATIGIVPVGLEVTAGYLWERATTFDNDVYFSFSTVRTDFNRGPTSGCGDWVQRPPRSSEGQYFVGLSEPMPSERLSREAAMRDARLQTVRWVGESLLSGTIVNTSVVGNVQDLSAWLNDDTNVQAASAGVASMVKDENWCVVPEATPEGTKYKASVLALLPKAEAEAAAKSVSSTAAAAGAGSPAAPETSAPPAKPAKPAKGKGG